MIAHINVSYCDLISHKNTHPDMFVTSFYLGLEVLINLTRLNVSYNRICDLSGKIEPEWSHNETMCTMYTGHIIPLVDPQWTK